MATNAVTGKLKHRTKRGVKPVPPIPKTKRTPPARPVDHIGGNGVPCTQPTVGPPHIILTEEEIGKLKGWIACGMSLEDCAAYIGVSKDTLERNYMDVISMTRILRNAQLRRKQFEQAMDGNTGMLVWLGKQWLGQTDQMQLGNNPDNPLLPAGASKPLIEVVFIEADGNGHPKIFDDTQPAPPQLEAKNDAAEDTRQETTTDSATA